MSYDQEREFLREAAAGAGMIGDDRARFIEQVIQRLEKGAQEYGDNGYLDRTFLDVIAEVAEEAADIGGWSGLGLRLLQRDVKRGYPAAQAELVHLHLVDAVAHSVAAWNSLNKVRELYEEERVPVAPQPRKPWFAAEKEAERARLAT